MFLAVWWDIVVVVGGVGGWGEFCRCVVCEAAMRCRFCISFSVTTRIILNFLLLCSLYLRGLLYVSSV